MEVTIKDHPTKDGYFNLWIDGAYLGHETLSVIDRVITKRKILANDIKIKEQQSC
jgi:hypothetical protein